jgi:hypothetical protein
VVELSLSENNLVGSLPTALSQLTSLRHLDVGGNHLHGPVPGPLLTRFDRGELVLTGYASEFAGICQVELQDRHNEFECGDLESSIRADGSVTVARKRCGTDPSLPPFWEKGTGQIARYDVDRIARLTETEHFARLLAAYESHETHGEVVSITVVYRDGSRKSVREFGGAAPTGFWLLKRTIAGALRDERILGMSMARDTARQ